MGQSETVTQNAGIGGTLNWVTKEEGEKKEATKNGQMN
jgi:hypothetical protein